MCGRVAVAAIAGALFLTASLPAGVAGEGDDYVNLERLSDRVVLGYWVGPDRRCNLTAIRTRQGLVLIDTEMSPRVMAPVKRKLEQTLGRTNWVYVINTHAHDSHAGGNSLFKGAVIVGHDNLARDMSWILPRQTGEAKRQNLARADQLIQDLQTALTNGYGRVPAQARLIRSEIKWQQLHAQDLREGYPVVKPSLTFADQTTLDLGDVQLELVYFGRSHSLSDILVYVPQERSLVTGGIIYQRAQFPEISQESRREDMQRFLTVLDRFLAPGLKLDRVVPSHSPPLLKRDLAPVRDYYQRMLAGLTSAWQEGLTLEQAKERFPASQFPALIDRPPGVWCHGMHERNLDNLWRIVQAPEVRKMEPQRGVPAP